MVGGWFQSGHMGKYFHHKRPISRIQPWGQGCSNSRGYLRKGSNERGRKVC